LRRPGFFVCPYHSGWKSGTVCSMVPREGLAKKATVSITNREGFNEKKRFS
jgi:hypothetical protein